MASKSLEIMEARPRVATKLANYDEFVVPVLLPVVSLQPTAKQACLN
jgi:hypothetical protein